jgi:hypothetical protein
MAQAPVWIIGLGQCLVSVLSIMFSLAVVVDSNTIRMDVANRWMKSRSEPCWGRENFYSAALPVTGSRTD